ncbi:MAG: hypothetical protein H0W12_02405 [Chitinophagaceae bacterium]|nr:hypothetical protein [Chitinophagaceae bacterium]
MKKYFFSFLLTAFCMVINAQSKTGKPYLTKSLSGQSVNNVMVETAGGNITVEGVADAETRLEIYVSASNNRLNALSAEEIRKKVNEDYDLNISVTDNRLTATAKSKEKIHDWKRSLTFSFKIYVQQNAGTDLTTSGGNIQLKNLTGTENFTTSGGNLVVENVGGKIKGITSGGNINLLNSKDDIDLTTSGGNITADNSSGDISITTSGGTLKLQGLNGKIHGSTSGGNIDGEGIHGEFVASTSGGNIVLDNMYGSVDAATSGGNIHATIKELGKYLTLSNSSGNIDVQVPNKGMDLKLSANKIKTETLNNFIGEKDDDELAGTINGGGIPVKINAGSGKISLSFN